MKYKKDDTFCSVGCDDLVGILCVLQTEKIGGVEYYHVLDIAVGKDVERFCFGFHLKTEDDFAKITVLREGEQLIPIRDCQEMVRALRGVTIEQLREELVAKVELTLGSEKICPPDIQKLGPQRRLKSLSFNGELESFQFIGDDTVYYLCTLPDGSFGWSLVNPDARQASPFIFLPATTRLDGHC